MANAIDWGKVGLIGATMLGGGNAFAAGQELAQNKQRLALEADKLQFAREQYDNERAMQERMSSIAIPKMETELALSNERLKSLRQKRAEYEESIKPFPITDIGIIGGLPPETQKNIIGLLTMHGAVDQEGNTSRAMLQNAAEKNKDYLNDVLMQTAVSAKQEWSARLNTINTELASLTKTPANQIDSITRAKYAESDNPKEQKIAQYLEELEQLQESINKANMLYGRVNQEKNFDDLNKMLQRYKDQERILDNLIIQKQKIALNDITVTDRLNLEEIDARIQESRRTLNSLKQMINNQSPGLLDGDNIDDDIDSGTVDEFTRLLMESME